MKKLCFLLLLLTLSCKEDSTIPAIIDSSSNVPTLQSFKSKFGIEANLRNKNVDSNNLILILDDLFGSGAGFWDGKNTITIDKKTWDSFDDLEKEVLVFHEMGHALLNRGHLNTRFDNGEMVSIMRAGDGFSVQGVDYSNAKRKYYLDELFDKNTPKPNWADALSYTNNIAEDKRKLLFKDDFTDNKNNWLVSKNTDSVRVQNGKYIVKATTNSIIVNAPFKVDTLSDFDIEFDMKTNGDAASLYFGSFNDNNVKSVGIYYSNQSVSFQLDNFRNFGINLFAKSINRNSFNTFRFRKQNNQIHFFVNNVYLHSMSALKKQTEKPWWFVCLRDSNAQYEFDNFRYYTIF